MSLIKLSIIIPVYNGSKYIFECVDSIGDIADKHVEVIIVDDGSTDDTKIICQGFQECFDNIHYFYQCNSGQGAARNYGLKKASGKYIMFLDADDTIEKIAIDRIVELIDKQDHYDFIYFRWRYFEESLKNYTYPVFNKYISFGELFAEQAEHLLNSKVYFTVNFAYRKQFLLENKIVYGEGYIYEDYEFYAQVLTSSIKALSIDDILYNVRLNSNSTTRINRDTNKHFKSFLSAVNSTRNKVSCRGNLSEFFLVSYFMNRAYVYHKDRIPNNLKVEFIKKVLFLFKDVDYDSKFPFNRYSLMLKLKVNKNQNYFMFLFIMKIFTFKFSQIIYKLKNKF